MAKTKAPKTTEDGNQYEAMFLLPANAATEAEKSLANIRGIIERHGGKVIVLKKWDERKLAYELAGNKRGFYVITYFRGPGNAVGGIERDVNLSEDVLRVLITKADHLNEKEMAAVEPQPIQPREERTFTDRGGFGDRGGYGDRGYGDRDRGYGDRPDRGDRPPAGADDRRGPPRARPAEAETAAGKE